MSKNHHYSASINWTGNKGSGTSSYRDYERSYDIAIEGKPVIKASSDPAFLGDETKHNPEDLFLASISSCHMLWFLHLCAQAGVIVSSYHDEATGTMEEEKDGKGRFVEVVLAPKVEVEHEEMIEKANALHKKANEMCFIANSCNFKIVHQAEAFVKTKK
tara:strand:- start:5961 stop:6440 length:480 start_codon:yes stop_codon:yes gene_type:complete